MARPRRHVLAVLTGLGLLAALPATTSAADTTPPVGTLLIEGGAYATNHTDLTVDVSATDDIGVTEVWIRDGGGPWTVYPYAPVVTYSLPAATVDGMTSLEVEWYDAAGNGSAASGMIVIDRVPPSAPLVNELGRTGSFGTLQMRLAAAEEVSGTPFGQFSPDGSTWGAALPLTETGSTEWNAFDPSEGGANEYGTRTAYARVRDGAGNWSPATSFEFTISPPVPSAISWPANATTGQPVTLHLAWPAGMPPLPGDTKCLWSLVWGDDRARNQIELNETFGYVLTFGPASAGFCEDWTIALPWVPVRQFGVEFQVGATGLIAGFDGEHLTAALGSSDRHIASSSLPVGYLLPSEDEITLGETITYQLFLLHGASATDGLWVAQTGDYDSLTQHGGSSFTFKPNRVGDWRVSWRSALGSPAQGGGFDPPVRPRSGGGGGAGATQVPALPTNPPPSATAAAAPTTEPSARPTSGSIPTPHPTATAAAAAPSNDPAAPAPEMGIRTPWLLVGLAAMAALIGAGSVAWRRGSLRPLIGFLTRFRTP
jgi:hypothetical protein